MRPAGLHAVRTDRDQRQSRVSQGHPTPRAHSRSHASAALIVHCSASLMCRSHSASFTITSAVSLQGKKWWKWAKLFYVQGVRLPQGWKLKEESDPLSEGLKIPWHQLMCNDVVVCLMVDGKEAMQMEPTGFSTEFVNIAKDDPAHHERLFCASVSLLILYSP